MTRTGWLAAWMAIAVLAGTAPPAEAGRRRSSAPFVLDVSSPANGEFDDTGSTTVTGTVAGPPPSVLSLEINGVPVTIQEDRTFSHVVPLDPVAVVNPITTVVTRTTNGIERRDRRVVMAGDSVADGDYSLEGIALRLNDTGLDQLEPVIEGLVALDPASLVPPGTVVIEEYCYLRLIWCIGAVRVSIDTNPAFPPSISGFTLDVDSQTNLAFGDIALNDLFVRARVDDTIGVPLTCFIDVSTVTTAILGDYALEPDAIDPSLVDVAQLGGVSVNFSGFDDSTDCNGLLGGLVEVLIGLFIGDVETLFDDAFSDFLNMVDPAGNTPVAGAIESALAEISIAGSLSESLGVMLDAPLFQVAEDVDGITLGSDGSITADFGTGPGQCDPPSGAPDLPASHHVDESFPSLGRLTPGGLPYGLGICVSTSAFNQLLKAEIECGLLQADITEIDLLGNLQPLTTGLASIFIPEFGSLDPTMPLTARLRPTIAPIVTGSPGPAGEMAEIRMGQLVVDLMTDVGGPTEATWVSVAADFSAGLELQFDAVAASLVPTISPVQAQQIQVGVLATLFPTLDTAQVELLLPEVLALALPSLGDSLGSFPFPAFFGLDLSTVEVSRQGEFMSIFADLVAP